MLICLCVSGLTLIDNLFLRMIFFFIICWMMRYLMLVNFSMVNSKYFRIINIHEACSIVCGLARSCLIVKSCYSPWLGRVRTATGLRGHLPHYRGKAPPGTLPSVSWSMAAGSPNCFQFCVKCQLYLALILLDDSFLDLVNLFLT